MNSDYQFEWDLINKYLGNDDTEDTEEDEDGNNIIKQEQEEGGEDRPYTLEEIKTMFNAAQDKRAKIIFFNVIVWFKTWSS